MDNENIKNIDAYIKSKTLKEKAAFYFASKNKIFKTYNDSASLGTRSRNWRSLEATSFKLFNAVAKKEMPVAPPFKFGLRKGCC